MTNNLSSTEINWINGINEMTHMKQEESIDYIQGKQYGWGNNKVKEIEQSPVNNGVYEITSSHPTEANKLLQDSNEE